MTEKEQIEAIRLALGGYPDSDLVSLATTMRVQCDAYEWIAEARHAPAVKEFADQPLYCPKCESIYDDDLAYVWL